MGGNRKTAHSTTRYPKAAIVANTRGQLAVLPLSLQTTTHSAPPTNKAANNTLPSGNWLIYVSILPHFCYMKDGPARQRGHHNHTGCIARAINRHHQLIRKTDLNLSSSPKTAPITQVNSICARCRPFERDGSARHQSHSAFIHSAPAK